MKHVFADTSYFIALLSRRDAHHEKARALARTLDAPLVTSEPVLTELLDAFSDRPLRRPAERLVDALRDGGADVVSWSGALFDRALGLWKKRHDKEWGLTDCASFVIMAEREIAHALTADAHFQQAGFRALLLE